MNQALSPELSFAVDTLPCALLRFDAGGRVRGGNARLLALLGRATLVLTPDSGPTHMAHARGTAVLGLHACTDAERSGPYSDRRWCVNRYDEAARRFLGKPASALPWGKRVEFPGVMDLVETADVVDRFEAFRAARGA